MHALHTPSSRPRRLRLTLKLFLLCVASGLPAAAQSDNVVRYGEPPIVKDLGALPPTFDHSQAFAISTRGLVVGSLIQTGRDEANHAFLDRDNRMIDLGTLPTGTFSDAYGVNDRAQVVGRALYVTPGLPLDRFFHAFLWEKGVMHDLGTLGQSSSSIAYGINIRGQVVGESAHAFLYENGTMKDLGTLLGGDTSVAYAINDAGQIVGGSTLADGSMHAFLYRHGVMQDLGTLAGGRNSVARAINNSGQIVGSSTVANGTWHAFLYDDGHMIDLTTFPGGAGFSDAKSINDRGQIVGPGLLFDDGKVIPINPSSSSNNQVPFAFAAAINNSGEIAGVLLPAFHAAILDSNELTDDAR